MENPLIHRFVEVNGVRLHIAERGHGPLVLLLHGWPESWYSWRHQFGPLAAAGYRVVAPDQRGYARSEQPPDVTSYTLLHLVGDVIALIEELGGGAGGRRGSRLGCTRCLDRGDAAPGQGPRRGRAQYSADSARRDGPAVDHPDPVRRGLLPDYFLQPRVADAELARDIPDSFRRILVGASLLHRCHAHGLIAKFPHSRRWRVTRLGRVAMAASIQLREIQFLANFLRAAS